MSILRRNQLQALDRLELGGSLAQALAAVAAVWCFSMGALLLAWWGLAKAYGPSAPAVAADIQPAPKPYESLSKAHPKHSWSPEWDRSPDALATSVETDGDLLPLDWLLSVQREASESGTIFFKTKVVRPMKSNGSRMILSHAMGRRLIPKDGGFEISGLSPGARYAVEMSLSDFDGEAKGGAGADCKAACVLDIGLAGPWAVPVQASKEREPEGLGERLLSSWPSWWVLAAVCLAAVSLPMFGFQILRRRSDALLRALGFRPSTLPI